MKWRYSDRENVVVALNFMKYASTSSSIQESVIFDNMKIKAAVAMPTRALRKMEAVVNNLSLIFKRIKIMKYHCNPALMHEYKERGEKRIQVLKNEMWLLITSIVELNNEGALKKAMQKANR